MLICKRQIPSAAGWTDATVLDPFQLPQQSMSNAHFDNSLLVPHASDNDVAKEFQQLSLAYHALQDVAFLEGPVPTLETTPALPVVSDYSQVQFYSGSHVDAFASMPASYDGTALQQGYYQPNYVSFNPEDPPYELAMPALPGQFDLDPNVWFAQNNGFVAM